MLLRLNSGGLGNQQGYRGPLLRLGRFKPQRALDKKVFGHVIIDSLRGQSLPTHKDPLTPYTIHLKYALHLPPTILCTAYVQSSSWLISAQQSCAAGQKEIILQTTTTTRLRSDLLSMTR